jgi:hypothetical protein
MEPVDDKGKGEASDGPGNLDAVQQMLRDLANGCVAGCCRARRREAGGVLLSFLRSRFAATLSLFAVSTRALTTDTGTGPVALEAVEALTRRTLVVVVAHGTEPVHRCSLMGLHCLVLLLMPAFDTGPWAEERPMEDWTRSTLFVEWRWLFVVSAMG